MIFDFQLMTGIPGIPGISGEYLWNTIIRILFELEGIVNSTVKGTAEAPIKSRREDL